MKNKNSKPTVTIYITNYNYGKYIDNAIQSVLSQTYIDYELIIIDDGSNDDSKEIINNYEKKQNVFVVFQKNKGLNVSNNVALSLARGKFIVRLDADDYFAPQAIDLMVSELERNPDYALVFPDYYLIDEGGEIFSHERRRKLYSDDHLMELPPNGACTLVRTNILRQLGGYREDLGAQDGLDLWVKLKDNYNAANINLPLFYIVGK